MRKVPSADDRDRWYNQGSSCINTPPPIENLDHARYLLNLHSGHGCQCKPFLAALSRSSGAA